MEDNTLLTFQEFCDYLRIKPTLGKKLIADPGCKYLVRIGSRVMIHKALLDHEVIQSAKTKNNLLKSIK
jgi:hypothetical protein